MELISLLLGLASLGLAGLALYNSSEHKYIRRFFAAFAAGLGLWMISVALADLSRGLGALVFWTKMATIVSSIGVASFVQFAYFFRRPKTRLNRLILWQLPVLILILYILPFPTDKVYLDNPFNNINPNRPVGGTLSDAYAAYIPLLFFYLIWATVILLRRRRALAEKIKNQIYYITLGAGITMLAGILFDAVLPVLGIDYLYSLGPMFAVALVVCTAYAILRHELLDIRIIIQRGVIYSVLFAIIAIIYLLLVLVLNNLLAYADKTATFVGGFVTGLIGIWGARPLESYFRRKTDAIFFKDQYNYADTLHELSAILNTSIEQEDIITRAQHLLKQALRAQDIRISLGEGEAVESALAIPLMIEQRSIGSLTLGPKRSGEAYTSRDFQLLDTFAYQAAVALEKSRLYAELKRYSQTLEQQVEQRTRSLQAVQEQERQTMLDIAHNLQTPLTALRAELTYRMNSDPEQPPDFDSLEHSISEVSKFIYDLLTLARLENKLQTPIMEPVDFSSITEEVVEYVTLLAEEQGIKLTSRIEPNLAVAGNAEDLKSLLVNLLSNAIKYTKNQPRKQVTVTLRQTDNSIRLIIEDTGRGIAAPDLAKIFDRFYRGYRNTDDEVVGSGLGLAICKAIVDRHGGQIKITSQLNQGTKVDIYI